MTSQAGLLRLFRRVTLVIAFGGLAYLVVRFDLVSLPPDGCSPVAGYGPGDRLVVDRRPPRIQAGDAVLVRDGAGVPHLTSVDGTRRDDGALWCAPSAPDCPGLSSEEVGWIPRESVVGRVLLSWNF